MDEDDLLEKAQSYASARGCSIAERLGFGIHGIVFVLEREGKQTPTALKIHAFDEPYRRERNVYRRLSEMRVRGLRGLEVPQLLAWDDDLLALEMTIVSPPFVLDFAGAFLDFPPDFSPESWQDWERKNAEQFGEDWPAAQAILAEFEDLGIHMLDPSPSNIRFR